MTEEFDRVQYYLDHTLKPDDKIVFQCQMCGSCCRKRSESILLTGADLFRIAKYLGVSTAEASKRYTTFGVGRDSCLPLLYLKERQDGSCSLLRNGKCTVQSEKPAVCAIYPLGRMIVGDKQEYAYFTQPVYCAGDVGHTGGEAISQLPADKAQEILNDPELKSATVSLEEWLSQFNIRAHEKEYIAWNKLAMQCSEFIREIVAEWKKQENESSMQEKLNQLELGCFMALYIGYDTEKDYIEQLKDNAVIFEKIKEHFLNE